jgi:electron transport complex protein RnfB
MSDEPNNKGRRDFLAKTLRVAGLLAAGGVAGKLVQSHAAGTVWQIDPKKCTYCGKCATACVLTPSAVKCLHAYALCGYCDFCFGYFRDQRSDNTTGAENQRCPTDAIRRTFIEDPYYQYVIDEQRCIGCAICVKGCTEFGNGSLFLQIRHDRCVNCNHCNIATECPANAISRVPANTPYKVKSVP